MGMGRYGKENVLIALALHYYITKDYILKMWNSSEGIEGSIQERNVWFA